MEQTDVWTFEPFGYKPSDGDEIRKLWSVKATVNIDEFLVALNQMLGEQ